MEKHGFERPKYFVPPGKGTDSSTVTDIFLSILHSFQADVLLSTLGSYFENQGSAVYLC